MFKCPHCDTEIEPGTLAAGNGTLCPGCGNEVEVLFEDFELSSLAGGSPADGTARPLSDSGPGGSSFALSGVSDSELESDQPASSDLPDATLVAASDKPRSSDPPPPGDAGEDFDATLALGGDDDGEAPLMLAGEEDDDDFSALDARSPGESLNATVDFGHLARAVRRDEENLAGRPPVGDATLAFGGAPGAKNPTAGSGAEGSDLTQMVGLPLLFPGARAATRSDATLPADSDRAGSDVSDSSLGKSSDLAGRDSAGDRTESPSTHAEGGSFGRDSATLAFDSERRSDRSPTPEPIDITGLSSGNTVPRGRLEGGRGTSQLGPGDSQVVGDESVRLRAFLLSDAASNDPATIDYAIEGEAGKGGMGVVYKARQQSLNRLVAIKQIKTEMGASASDLNKFISEAVITGQLEHPNIAPVHDLGLAADGLPFYAMKFVEGRDWEDSIKDLSEEENLAILIQVAQAIAFAHSKNVVHRDLKPGNVRLGAFGEVLVMDWGLAARLDDGSEIQPAGTPIYMPPETALEYLDYAKGKVVGRRVDSSRRRVPAGKYCDVYLLGALLFKIVTGRAPHRGKSTFECLRAAAKNEIVKVRRSSELLDIAYKAMATDPEHRHASALEFIDAIRAYQSHAQSIKIARRASQELRAAEDLREQQGAKATDIYACYSRAQHGYQNALELWSENKKASRRLKRTLRSFAEAAYGNGDYDLALSLLDDQSEDDAAMRVTVLKDQKARNWRDKSYGYLRAGLVAASVMAIGAMVWSEVVQRKAAAAIAELASAEKKLVQVEDEAKRTVETAQRDASKKIDEANRMAEMRIAQGQSEAERKVSDAEEKAALREKQADALVAKAKQDLETTSKALTSVKAESQQQTFLAALGSISAKLADDGAYAASKLVAQTADKLTKEQKQSPEWASLSRAIDLRDEVSQVLADEVAGKGAAGAALVASTPDGSTLATLDRTGRLAVYEPGAAAPTAAYDLGLNAQQLVIDPSGRRAAAVAEGVHWIDLASGQVTPVAGTARATAIAFQPGTSVLLVGDSDGGVRRVGIDSKPDVTVEANRFHEAAITALGYSPDGKQWFSADTGGRLVLWREGNAGELPARETYSHAAATGAKASITAAVISNDAAGRAAYGLSDGTVHEIAGWWATAGAANPQATEPDQKARPAESRRLASGFLDVRPTRLRDTHPRQVSAIAYDASEGLVLSAGGGTLLVQASPTAGGDLPPKRERRYHDSDILALAVSGPDHALSSDEKGRIVRWKIGVPAEDLAVMDPRGARVAAVRLSPNREGTPSLVVADTEGFVHRWADPARPARVSTSFAGHAEHRGMQAWRVAGDSPQLVTVASEDLRLPNGRRVTVARACVWDSQTGLLLRSLDLGERTVVDLDPTRRVLYASATGRLLDPSDKRAVALCFPIDGSAATPLWTERTRVSRLAALEGEPRGALLAVGMRDGQVFLWGPDSGRLDLTPSSVRPHWSPVRSFAFDRSTRRLASGDNEGKVALWSLDAPRLIAKRRLSVENTPSLSPVERLSLAEGGAMIALLRAPSGAGEARLIRSDASLADLGRFDARDADLASNGSTLTLLSASGAHAVRHTLTGNTAPQQLSIESPAEHLSVASDGLLVWGAGFAEWRPSDGGRFKPATRVTSRPTTVAVIEAGGGDDLTVLTSAGTLDRWDSAGKLRSQRRLGDGAPVLAATPTSDRRGWLVARQAANAAAVVQHWSAKLDHKIRDVTELPNARRVILAEARGVVIAATTGRAVLASLVDDRLRETVQLGNPEAASVSVALHPAEQRFLIACEKGPVVFGERRDGAWLTTSLLRDDIVSLAYTPDGERVLAGIESGRVELLELVTGEGGTASMRTLLTFAGHSARVTHLEASRIPDGVSLVSGDAGGRVVVRQL